MCENVERLQGIATDEEIVAYKTQAQESQMQESQAESQVESQAQES